MVAPGIFQNTSDTIDNGMRCCQRICAVVGLSVVLSACASSPNVGVSSPDDPQTQELISQTIELVATRYIDPISREQILVNTLDGLSAIDDDIRVDITPNDLILQYEKKTVDRIALPVVSGEANDQDNITGICRK